MNINMPGGKTAAGRMNEGSAHRRSLWKSPALITALILLIPLLGNHFVDGWNWPLRAFVLAGTLLFGTGVTYELATRNVDTIAYRAAVGIALAAGLLLLWFNRVQIADGDNPASVMFLGVPLVGIIGAAMARFQPSGMARALFATALAQALVLAIALMIRNPLVTAGESRVFGLNAFVLMAFVGSALLFQKAGRVARVIR